MDNPHGNRSQIAAQRLRQMIVAGDLLPGQRISERIIRDQLDGLSRTPLREAFKILAAEGLLTIAPNKGASVTALTVKEVEDAIEFLIGLEGFAAIPACERIAPEALAEIEALHEKMLEAYRGEALMRYFELNQAIHQRIVDAAGNSVLSRIYAAECARIRRYRFAGNHRHERWDRAVAEHERILDALRERNGSLLRELFRAHHLNGWKVSRNFVSMPEGTPDASSVRPEKALRTEKQHAGSASFPDWPAENRRET